MKIDIPYGKTVLSADIPDIRVSAVLNNRLHDYEPLAAADELVEQALASPISSPPLCELAKGKRMWSYWQATTPARFPARQSYQPCCGK